MPQFIVPARNPRHRTACFALYKALLRQGSRVPLPAEIADGLGPGNPIKKLIRSGFRRNKNDTSPRLVVCALQNGYRFLELLTAAQSRATPQHASVMSELRTRLASRVAARARTAAQPAHRAPSSAPHPERTPLLTRVGDGRYRATARPLALERLAGGARGVPSLAEANGVPFLRLGKPQPRSLSRVLRQKILKRTLRVETLQRLEEQDAAAAKWEDLWERAVGEGRDGASYVGGVQEGIGYLKETLDAEHADRMARGKVMWEIVQAERELAVKERAERQRKEDAGSNVKAHT